MAFTKSQLAHSLSLVANTTAHTIPLYMTRLDIPPESSLLDTFLVLPVGVASIQTMEPETDVT